MRKTKKSKITKKPVKIVRKKGINRKPPDFETQSDKRTASFVARRLSEIITEIADLIPDMQSLDRYTEVENASYAIRKIKLVRTTFEEIQESGCSIDNDASTY